MGTKQVGWFLKGRLIFIKVDIISEFLVISLHMPLSRKEC